MRNRWLTPDAPGEGYICRTLKIPNSTAFMAVVNGALLDLTQDFNWEKHGTLTPEQVTALMLQMWDDYRESRGCLIGTIFAHANANAPTGSLPCDGATYLIADYPDLAARLDSTYHVNATHFRTPDLRGRSIIGTGQGSGLSNRTLDASGGEETHALTEGEMPVHNHSYTGATTTPFLAGEIPSPIVAFPTPALTGYTGGGAPHSLMHPYRAIHYAIWAR